MNYQEYIDTELLVLIPVTYLLGVGLKKSKISDKWIPVILGVGSIVLSFIWIIAKEMPGEFTAFLGAVFKAVTQGILIAGASVYANQIYVQAKKEE